LNVGKLEHSRPDTFAHFKVSIYVSTSREAEDYVSQIGSTIVLINGERLAQLMIDHGVGVSVAATYEIKRIDSDYFTEGD
jgi:restriction system protein